MNKQNIEINMQRSVKISINAVAHDERFRHYTLNGRMSFEKIDWHVSIFILRLR